jgi:hypothetical protein
MLSKAVKERRRFNRMLRSEPAWNVCMKSYKMQQLTIVRLHLQHLYSHLSHVADPHIQLEVKEKIKAKEADIENLKHQQSHMTREEWYAELDSLNGHHSDQRAWVRLLLEGGQDAL